MLFLILSLLGGNLTSAAKASELGKPFPTTWNLSELYPDVEAWQADYGKATALLEQYESYRGRLNNAQTIYEMIQFTSMGELSRIQARLLLYADLGHNLNPADPVFNNLLRQMDELRMRDKQARAFIDPEIYGLPLEQRRAIFSDPLFAGLQYVLGPYMELEDAGFTENENRIISTLSGDDGYARQIYDIINNVELPNPVIVMPDGSRLLLDGSIYIDIVRSDLFDTDFKIRANELMLTRPMPLIHTFAKLIEENAAQLWTKARLYDYDTTRAYKMDACHVDEAVYDRLIQAGHAGAVDYQRYLKARARAMGLEEQHSFDLLRPVSAFDPGRTPYLQAVAEVMEALRVFGQSYLDTFWQIISSGHVDVFPTETKVSGSFETQAGDELLPWVLLNYGGFSSDISTIAHEMGHAVYSEYAIENQNALNNTPPVFTQEIASTVNQLIYYTYKVNRAQSDDEKLYYLDNLLSMFGGTFFMQMMYAEFEDDFYKQVESGASLSAEGLGDKWMELNAVYRGDTITTFPNARYQWAAIPHFFDGYYVYQYASSIAYAASIAPRILNGEDGAVENYIAFLKRGNSASPMELLKTAGIDPLSDEPYQQAMQYFSGLVDEFEKLVEQKLAQ